MFPLARFCLGQQAATPRGCQTDSTSSMSEDWTTHDSNLVLYDCLSQPKGRRPSLPPEIIHLILAHSSRWILLGTEMFVLDSDRTPGGYRISRWSGHDSIPILTTQKLSRQDALSLGGVIFSFRSCDQGWSWESKSHGTFNGSCTWMETGVVGDDDALAIEQRWELQRNRHAGREPEDYRIEFGEGHSLFESLREGDRIGMWCRAMYPGWQNYVHEAKIEMWFHGPDDLQEGPSWQQAVG